LLEIEGEDKDKEAAAALEKALEALSEAELMAHEVKGESEARVAQAELKASAAHQAAAAARAEAGKEKERAQRERDGFLKELDKAKIAGAREAKEAAKKRNAQAETERRDASERAVLELQVKLSASHGRVKAKDEQLSRLGQGLKAAEAEREDLKRQLLLKQAGIAATAATTPTNSSSRKSKSNGSGGKSGSGN